MVNKEEKILQERLKSLENKYKEKAFSEAEKPAEPKIDFEEDNQVFEDNEERESIYDDEVKERENELGIKKLTGKNVLMPPEGVKKISELEIKRCATNIEKLKKEMSKIILGQEEIVNGLILGLLCNAHVLVEGVPGIAKTLAIRALAAASGCTVKRVQFTVDMLPTDIIGLTTYTPEKGFEIIKGPIFANFIIADEINRAPPKTQSALIEGMQEKQVTIGRKKFHLPDPFFVMATENPIENAGVYPLPEAQIDRFLFKLIMGYPKEEIERKVMETNITLKKFEAFGLKAVITPKDIIRMQEAVQKVYLDNSIKTYILSIVRKTRTKDFKNAEYVTYGSSPRASIGLFITSKAIALMNNRNYVLPEDVKEAVFNVMRHRLILSYKATLDKVSPDSVIQEILNSVKVE
jgi:MoxR-like ATPase